MQLQLFLKGSNLVPLPLPTDDGNEVPSDALDVQLFAYFAYICTRESKASGNLTCVLFLKKCPILKDSYC